MKQKVLKPLTPQKRMDILNELVALLKPLCPPEHARGIELIARLACDAGMRNGKKLLSKKGAKHDRKKTRTADTKNHASPEVTDA